MTKPLYFAPLRVPFVDLETGLISHEWQLLLQGFFNRIGGTNGLGSDDLAILANENANIAATESAAMLALLQSAQMIGIDADLSEAPSRQEVADALMLASNALDDAGSAASTSYTPPVTTKGDLFGFSTTPARVPIGSDTFVLTADSTQTLGLKWATPSPLTTKGDLYGFSAVPARLPVGTDGYALVADSAQATGLRWVFAPAISTPTPGTIADLVFWFQANVPNLSSAGPYAGILNSTPWLPNVAAPVTTPGVTRSATLLNSLGVATTPASSTGRYSYNMGLLANCTSFFVCKLNNATGGDFFSGLSSSLQYVFSGATGKPAIIKNNVAVIATATNALTVGTWYQGNVTYNSTTGAWVFRLGRAADSSGTNIQAITLGTTSLFYNQTTTSEDANFSLAELIVYNRVLTGAEITSVENYLFTKWGV